jgi:signal transduction histidine kinase
VRVEEHLPPILADLNYLTAAMECLLENAIKFTDHPGRDVSLHAYQEGDYLCLAVADQGRGIPAHEMSNIFKPFYQIERERYEDQGAGSGLAIVEKIVGLHGGSVVAESVFGEGSTFTLRLPIFETHLD